METWWIFVCFFIYLLHAFAIHSPAITSKWKICTYKFNLADNENEFKGNKLKCKEMQNIMCTTAKKKNTTLKLYATMKNKNENKDEEQNWWIEARQRQTKTRRKRYSYWRMIRKTENSDSNKVKKNTFFNVNFFQSIWCCYFISETKRTKARTKEY